MEEVIGHWRKGSSLGEGGLSQISVETMALHFHFLVSSNLLSIHSGEGKEKKYKKQERLVRWLHD